MERLLREIERLENLVFVLRAENRQLKQKLTKAEHDRDRYKERIENYGQKYFTEIR